MDYNVIAGNILKNVGGAQNVADVTHLLHKIEVCTKEQGAGEQRNCGKVRRCYTSCRSKRTVPSS